MRGLSTLAGLGSLILIVWVSVVMAQAEKPKPIVTVTKSDNSTVRGRLLQYDADAVQIEVGAKPGEGEVVSVPWKEISRLSNGLTYAKALDEWKGANAARLCETCRGDRAVRCKTCHGTGHAPEASKDCAKCKGAGEVACSQPKCKEGKIPCPGKCIKLSEGNWVKKDDGKRWRQIKMGKSVLSISDGHVGEVWEEENGQPVNRGKCTTCGGNTVLTCQKCEGTSKAPCATCIARKDAADCADCDAGRVACETCKASGLKPL